MNELIRSVFIYILIFIFAVAYFKYYSHTDNSQAKLISSTQLETVMNQNQIQSVIVSDNTVNVFVNNEKFYIPKSEAESVLSEMKNKGVKIEYKARQQELITRFLNVLPWLVLFVIWLYVLRRRRISR